MTPILTALVEVLLDSRQTVEQINQACIDKGLPCAFPIGDSGIPQIPGNLDYRFEGFGLIAGFAPKFSFWVHYKPESPEHVELGRFTVKISFAKFAVLARIIR